MTGGLPLKRMKKCSGFPALCFPPAAIVSFTSPFRHCTLFVRACFWPYFAFCLSFFLFFYLVRSLEDAEAEAANMIGGLITAEYARLLQRQSNGWANRVYNSKLASRANPAKVDDDVEPSKKHKRAVAKGGPVQTRRAAKDAAETDADDDDDCEREEVLDDDAGSRGYTPSPIRAKTGAGSSTSPPRPQDVAGTNVLLAIAGAGSMAGAAARKKKKEVVQVSGGFSDSVRSLGGAPTLPALRRPLRWKRLSLPPPASDADAPTGGSVLATAAASNLALQPAGPNVSGTHGAVTLPFVSRQREGKSLAVEMTVFDISLTAC